LMLGQERPVVILKYNFGITDFIDCIEYRPYFSIQIKKGGKRR